MNSERITGDLRFRARMWHRATSFRARPVHEDKTYDEDGNVTNVTPVAHDVAVKRAVAATSTLRQSFFNLAIKAGTDLIRALVEETVEQRPDHLDRFVYNDNLYVRQRVEGETAYYVQYANYDENNYVFDPITHEERIRKEIVSMRELATATVLTALAPTQIETDTDFA